MSSFQEALIICIMDTYSLFQDKKIMQCGFLKIYAFNLQTSFLVDRFCQMLSAFKILFGDFIPLVTFPAPSFIPFIVFFLLINLKIGTSLHVNLTNSKEIILLFCPVNKLCPNINPVHEKKRDGMFTSMKLICPFAQITKFNWSGPFIAVTTAVFYCIQCTDIFFVNFWRTSILLWGH